MSASTMLVRRHIQGRGHGLFPLLQALLLTICLTGPGGAWAFVGDYQRAAPTNGWHTGTLSRVSDSDYKWTNRTGTSWTVTMDIAKGELKLGAGNPYPTMPTTHGSFKLVTDSAGLIGFDFGGERYLRITAISDVVGQYQRNPVQSGWNSGTIALKPGSTTILRWTNQAGFSWDLTPDLVNKLLRTDATNPYQNTPGGQNFSLQESRGVVAGFRFNGEFYTKTPVPQPIHRQRLGFYLGSQYSEAATTTHTAGFSFYSAVWSLTPSPLADLQVGMPGTWLLPNNKDFTQPLLPPDNPVRIGMPERGPTWSDVFQTIEGSTGTWVTTQFPSAVPKFRMNSTPNGYINEVSSPGWGFGQPTALPASAMGLAQLSNRLLVPPDGLTFSQQPNGQMLGQAWMTMPLIPAIDGAGTQSWTFFMNSSNFKGPVAFFVPQIWTRYSKVYPTIVGRGLDTRPGLVGPPTMEFGDMPMMVQYSSNGKFYGRIPRLQFPTNGNRVSHLSADMALYSKTALSDGVGTWMNGGSAPAQTFNTSGRILPKIQSSSSALELYVHETSKKVKVSGSAAGSVFATGTTTNPKQAFGLQWTATSTSGVWPEYYVLNANTFEPIAANLLPSDITLTTANFAADTVGSSYTAGSTWNSPAPVGTTTTVTLSDGTKLVYAWYKFIDQPSLQGFFWTASQKATIQARIEKIHSSWSTQSAFMEAPSVGTLATMDPNLIVTPPAGMTIGYVPIVIGQSKP